MKAPIKLLSIVLLSALIFTGCGGSKNSDFHIITPGPIPVGYVIFITNGGNSVPGITIIRPPGSAVVPAPVPPVRGGYDFEGWYDDPELKNRVTFPITVQS